MPRQRFYWDADREEWSDYKRPAATAVYVIRDEMESAVNHADGRRYTSKRAFTKAVRAAGCEIIGNERTDHIKPPPLHAPREVGMDIKRALEQYRSR